MPSAPQDSAEFDVFVSYRQKEPDQSWVRSVLVPALRQQSFRVCLDVENFRLGAPVLSEMERAVLHSRYTLAVLSPEYLASNFTRMENLMAEQLGLEQSRRRLLAVMRRDCDPGLRVRMRLWLDMTADEQFHHNLARLADQLRLPPDE